MSKSLTGMLSFQIWLLAVPASANSVGDRLVISINNIPYTQRQVESYVDIKECLRPKVARVRLVDKSNWQEALTVFKQDMVIYQESQRLGSFSSASALISQYRELVDKKIQSDNRLRDTFSRLGLVDLSIARVLGKVLRVVAFRKSKEKFAANEKKWLSEMLVKAVVVKYKDADKYVLIQPTLGKQVEGI